MPPTGERTPNPADAPRRPGRSAPEPGVVVVVADESLAQRVHTLACASTSGVKPPDADPVRSVPGFLAALGEATRGPINAVVGPADALAGMAEATAEALRQLAPDARLVLVCTPTDEPEALDALAAGFDTALEQGCTDHALADALGLPEAATPHEPRLRPVDPADLSTLQLDPPPAAPSPHDDAPPYQNTLDAALPPDLHDPPATPIVPDPDNPDQSLGDTDLVHHILRGEGELRHLALRMVRAQANIPGLGLADPGEPPPDGHLAVELAHEDHPFGTLHAPPAAGTRADPQLGVRHTTRQLAVWAQWLIHWLRLEAQFNRLRDLAMKDELTGAWNRRYFNHFLKKILQRAANDRRQVTLLVFDIDDFKVYNDRYGHPAGDEILRGVADLMKGCVREHDVVARIGGDEFAVIFWDAGEEQRRPHSRHPDDVLNAAKRFQRAVIEHRFPKLLDSAEGRLTISGGLAGYPWDGHTPEQLLHAADAMALQSKNQGKNAITFGPGAGGQQPPPPE
ncbi:MAG: diguanylate cyclase [Planctomycetota bacterium]